MFDKLVAWFAPLRGPYSGMSVKEAARLVYLGEEQVRNPNFTDHAAIFDSSVSNTIITHGGMTGKGYMGSQFEYLWTFYQGYKRSMPHIAPLTVMAEWERKAKAGGARG
jgi:hypothetical protein